MKIGGCRSLAFSLDIPKKTPWPFVKENTPLKGILCKCDALIIAEYKKKAYLIAMDMKSNNPGSADKQIASSHLLFQWIMGLLELHGHWKEEVYTTLGIISFKPRNQARKTTSRRPSIPSPRTGSFGMKIFDLRNHPRIFLPNLLDRLEDLKD